MASRLPLKAMVASLLVFGILSLPLRSARGFWFLPGFGNDNTADARLEAFGDGPITSPIARLDEATSVQDPNLNEADAPSAALTPRETPVTTSTANPATLAIPEEQDPDLTPTDQVRPELAVAQALVERPAPAVQHVLPLSAQDFDLAHLQSLPASSQAPRARAGATPAPLSSAEFDRVLPTLAFDTTYDLIDGAAQPALKTFPIAVLLEVEAGDTLSALFESVGISIVETQNAGRALGEVFNLGALRPGQVLELELDGSVEPFGANRLQRIALSPTNLERIEVVQRDGSFESRISRVELTRILIHTNGTLATGSVYADGDRMDVEGSMIANYVNALDAQLDFSRIQSVGDEIEMIYEAYFDGDGRLVDAGDVLYAAYRDQNGDDYEAFRFENEGRAAYFTRDARFTGQTNTLMRKPLGGGRLTSRFGMRTHAVYGDRRMHNGVDYGAACGTPIYAAGDGVITFAGWKGGYGRFIGIRHGSTFTTNYAHMRSFANGMRPGVRVRKGQLIGRVGTTGVSTGCHLHYEVVRNGSHINPLSEHIPRGDDLDRAARTRFDAFVGQLDAERARGTTLPQAAARAQNGTI